MKRWTKKTCPSHQDMLYNMEYRHVAAYILSSQEWRQAIFVHGYVIHWSLPVVWKQVQFSFKQNKCTLGTKQALHITATWTGIWKQSSPWKLIFFLQLCTYAIIINVNHLLLFSSSNSRIGGSVSLTCTSVKNVQKDGYSFYLVFSIHKNVQMQFRKNKYNLHKNE